MQEDITNKAFFQRAVRDTKQWDRGEVKHYGDCEIYSTAEICDCGLIRTLMFYQGVADLIYPKFTEDFQKHIKTIGELEDMAYRADIAKKLTQEAQDLGLYE